jgi:hypothetical protein
MYPKRVKRKTFKVAARPARSHKYDLPTYFTVIHTYIYYYRAQLIRCSLSADTLETILERLGRVEQSYATVIQLNVNNGPGTIAITQQQPEQTVNDSLSPIPTCVLTEGSRSPSLAGVSSTPEFDPAALLKDAVDEVQKRRLRSLTTKSMTEDTSVPKELAKAWIKGKCIRSGRRSSPTP